MNSLPSTSTPKRRSRRDGERSREAILREAARLATVEGLEGLSLGRLADAVGMSKSGIYAHFESKQDLQLATIDAAETVFVAEVIDPAQAADSGLDRLRDYSERFLAHVRDGVFPGGCFFAAAAMELDTRPGVVRDRALAVVNDWMELLTTEIETAQSAATLDGSVPPAQLAFELDAYLFLGNARFVAGAGAAALDQAQTAFDSRLRAAAAA